MSEIGFSQIPANTLVPFFYAEFDGGYSPAADVQNSLIVANTITDQPAVPVWCASVGQAIGLFGAGSLAAAMVEKLLGTDASSPLYVLPMADAEAGVAAGGKLVFTGTATSAGTLALYVAGRAVPVAVTAAMTAAQLATAAAAAINAWISANGVALPITAAVDGETATQVNLTAANAGTHGNSIDLRLNAGGVVAGEVTPAGITAAITAMANGATDPDLTGLDAILGDTNYDFIAIPWSSAAQLNALRDVMTARWAFNRQIYGHVWAAKADADATGATNITFGKTRNDPHVTVVSYEPAPVAPWDIAASYMAAAARSIRADANRPVQTLALAGVTAPPNTARYTWPTKNSLLASGMALMQYNPDNSCAILRPVTTYQVNGQGVPDASYRDAETLYGLMYFIRQMKSAIAIAFPRAKLADDGTNFGAGNTFTGGIADQPICTPKAARAVLIAAYTQMVQEGIVEDVDTFSKGLIVQRNAQDDSRLDILLDPIVVSGLRVVAAAVRFSLSDNSALAA